MLLHLHLGPPLRQENAMQALHRARMSYVRSLPLACPRSRRALLLESR